LIVGLSGLGAEVAKNLILAGPRAVTLMDDHEITGNDSLSQFFLSSESSKTNVCYFFKYFNGNLFLASRGFL
jgi:molybdopterin/thiamine biosynthesis adenylyltransferase